MADRQPVASFQGDPQLGRYELIAEIARGGMGTVLLARLAGAGGFQRLFAIKLLHRYLADDTEFVEMLLDEARIAARIHHPNVVSIQEVEQSAEHGYYLVMDYVEGFTLWDLANALADVPWRQRARIVLRVVIDALQGLEAAHTIMDDNGRPLGVVHRDVSPQNILVSSGGITRVTDFGIAKAASRITTTRVGQVKGKLAYMAPEQARGQDTDARTDVWAVAVVLWESLTAHRLFKAANDSETYGHVLTAAIPRLDDELPEAPAALSDALAWGLERDLARRAPSARQFALALESAARANVLLGDPHEIAAWMRERFASELAARRDAIKNASSSTLRAAGGVFSLPGGLHVPPMPERGVPATSSPVTSGPVPGVTHPEAIGEDEAEFDAVFDTFVAETDSPVALAQTAEPTGQERAECDDDLDDQTTNLMDPASASPAVKAALERARAEFQRNARVDAHAVATIPPAQPNPYARPSAPQGWVPFGSSSVAPYVPPVSPVVPGPFAAGPLPYVPPVGVAAGVARPLKPAVVPAKRSQAWLWFFVLCVAAGIAVGAFLHWRAP